ncbi:hypothetical protein ACIBCN_19035 [Nocardia sp. NPDC051052]|uniref:hypothetical protein n=1 Tax=Nocardia sp. NPDC051052 TaxID=3364322 RepID=UPI00379A0B0A
MILASDLEKYIGILPYDSEMFGVYQSLLGWKSKHIEQRFASGLNADKSQALHRITSTLNPQVEVNFASKCEVEFTIHPAVLTGGDLRTFDSYLMTELARDLPSFGEYSPEVWRDHVSLDRIREMVETAVDEIIREHWHRVCRESFETRQLTSQQVDTMMRASFVEQLRYESAVAGTLIHLVANEQWGQLKNLFYVDKDATLTALGLTNVLTASSAKEAYLDINTLDPTLREHLQAVGLSPISVVHLYRQYFFEFASFLGSPVGHVWLSPGSQVELIEVSTRRRYVEQVLEEETQVLTRRETETMENDELSDAVREDNRNDIGFGATGDVHQGWVGGDANASVSFDMKTTQGKAREVTHKRMRQQSEKLTSEIRKSVKSTFRTITETTDTSSKRYMLNNTTGDLVNYEMRRKMRQVGVQVQDVGTYLCWQTYVDDAGRDLGLGELLHIAKQPDLGSLRAPDELPMLKPYTTQRPLSVPFKQTSEDEGDKDEGYRNGVEVDSDFNEGDLEKVQYKFTFEASCDRANYVLQNVAIDPNGESVEIDPEAINIQGSGTKWTFDVVLKFVNFRGKDAVNIGATLYWSPVEAANTDVANENKSRLDKYDALIRAAYEKEFIESARERVTLASKIKQRPYSELREEERIVVYRALIQGLLTRGVPQPDDRSRHVVAELINAIFDVEKMLYFVSPEWWRPRLHHSHQELGKLKAPPVNNPNSPQLKKVAAISPAAAAVALAIPKFAAVVEAAEVAAAKPNPLLANDTVGWGGISSWRGDNYYITESSAPARLGSSLGWLMQLDGDNLRNAFLNAPWVKAVLPIRPGMEEAALNWLVKIEGTNGIGDEDVYHTNNPAEVDIDGNPLDGQKMLDVLHDLARQVEAKHAAAIISGKYPKVDQTGPANPVLVDNANTVTATPVERVYEHGFYPLVGGFRNNVGNQLYETVDQWVEILPTDQVVPVEVRYDPKTGQLL